MRLGRKRPAQLEAGEQLGAGRPSARKRPARAGIWKREAHARVGSLCSFNLAPELSYTSAVCECKHKQRLSRPTLGLRSARPQQVRPVWGLQMQMQVQVQLETRIRPLVRMLRLPVSAGGPQSGVERAQATP